MWRGACGRIYIVTWASDAPWFPFFRKMLWSIRSGSWSGCLPKVHTSSPPDFWPNMSCFTSHLTILGTDISRPYGFKPELRHWADQVDKKSTAKGLYPLWSVHVHVTRKFMFNASAIPRGDVANYHFWLYRVWQHLACDPDLWLADFPVSSLAASVSLPASNVIVSSLRNAADAWHNDMGMVFRVLEVRLSSVSERISGAQAQVTGDPHWSERDGRVQQCLQVFNFQHVGGILPSSPRNSDHRRACCFVCHYCPESRQSTC